MFRHVSKLFALASILTVTLAVGPTAAEEVDLVEPAEPFANVILDGGTLHPDLRKKHLSPDEQWLVFEADLATDDARDLWVVPTDASESPRRVHDQALPAGGHLKNYAFVGSEAIVYWGPLNTSATEELWFTPLDGSAPPRRIHGALGPGTTFRALYNLTADGSLVAYALRVADTRDELWVAPVDGSAAPSLLATAQHSSFEQIPSLLQVVQYGLPPRAMTPDGGRVVFEVEDTADVPAGSEQPDRLFSVATDGPASPQELTGLMPTDAEGVVDWVLDPTGSWVVYAADQAFEGVVEWWSVATDGSSAPFRLHAPLSGVAGADSGEAPIFVDGRVLTRISGDSGDELWTAPLDGTGTPVRMDLGAGAGAGHTLNIERPTTTPDGSRVVFVQDVTTNAVDEIFSAPVDGSAPATRLSAPGAHADVSQLTADGARVVFRADSDGDTQAQHFELYSVPVAGGPRTSLGPALDDTVTCSDSGSVTGVCTFEVGGSNVLFDAISQTRGAGLWTTPASGGAATLVDSRRLNLFFRRSFPGVTPPLTLAYDREASANWVRTGFDGTPPPALLTDNSPSLAIWPLGDGSRVVFLGQTATEQASLFIGDDGRHRVVAPQTAPNVQEGDVLELPVRLSQASVVPVGVDVAVAPRSTADAGDDYVSVPSTISFAPGKTETTIVIRTLEDEEVEVPETIELELSNAAGVPIDDPLIVVSIEDPAGPKVEFRETAWSVEEGSSFGLALEVVDGLNQPITVVVDRDPRDLGAASDDDFDTDPALPATLEIPAGDVAATLLFEALTDLRDESDETVRLEIASVEGAAVGPDDQVTVTITEPDVPDEDPIFDDDFESGDTSAWSGSG